MKKIRILFIAVFLVFLGASLAWAPCGISGYVYCDVDQDGIFNNDDIPLEGVDILLDGVSVATTDENGMYSIESHELCDGVLLSLDETTLPEEYTNYKFVNPLNNDGVTYEKVRADKEPPLPLPRQDFGVFDDACVPFVYEGCTPGFWKIKSNEKPHCWCSTYYDNPLLTQVYDEAALALYEGTTKNSDKFKEETLDDALDFKGGGDLEGAVRKMLRMGTAALLNACTPLVRPQCIICCSWNEEYRSNAPRKFGGLFG